MDLHGSWMDGNAAARRADAGHSGHMNVSQVSGRLFLTHLYSVGAGAPFLRILRRMYLPRLPNGVRMYTPTYYCTMRQCMHFTRHRKPAYKYLHISKAYMPKLISLTASSLGSMQDFLLYP